MLALAAHLATAQCDGANDESCSYASDDACDDGGPGSEYSVCALGTDCTDCGRGGDGDSTSSSPPPPPPPDPSPPPPSPSPPPTPPAGAPIVWTGTLKATHYWDCNGQGCDASTLSPYDQSRYWSSPDYMPQDPNDHGGPSQYGEKLWITGAASDALASQLGSDDGCCGSDPDSPGCGKCVLVQNPDSTHPDWLAIVMKKNRCPPWSSGCDEPNVHFDFAVPGFDHPQYSTANICGPNTGGWEEQEDTTHSSYVLGDWYTRHSTTAAASGECSELPAKFRAGCQRFADWGWRGGAPNLDYKIVECPLAFETHIANSFGWNGPASGPPQPQRRRTYGGC